MRILNNCFETKEIKSIGIHSKLRQNISKKIYHISFSFLIDSLQDKNKIGIKQRARDSRRKDPSVEDGGR